MQLQESKLKITFKWIIALVGWFGIILQLYLMLAGPNEKTILEKLVNFFSYFTILTNIIVATTLTVSLLGPGSRLGIFFSMPRIESAITVYIVIVGIIYYLFLMELWDPQRWQWVADGILHKVIPVLYLLYWFVFVPKGHLSWRNGINWLIYPLIYFCYVLLRGAIDGFYPYPFADVNQLGYGKALTNGMLIIVAFYVTGLILIMIDRLFASRGKSKV